MPLRNWLVPVRRKYAGGTGHLVFSFRPSRLLDPARPGLAGDHDKSVPEMPSTGPLKRFEVTVLHWDSPKDDDPSTSIMPVLARSGMEARLKVQESVVADTQLPRRAQPVKVRERPPRG